MKAYKTQFRASTWAWVIAHLVAAGTTLASPAATLIRPAPRDQDRPAIAANGEIYFVVWTDQREFNQNKWDIYGARVTRQGEVLDPSGIRICARPGTQADPSVASDGTNFLVVWNDQRTPEPSLDLDIYGARVTADGIVVETNGFPISQAVNAQFYPSLAFNGSHYLVAWYDYRNSTDRPINDIYGARVSQNGAVLDPGGLPICTAENMQWSPGVASLAGDFFVAWDDTRYSIRGTQVTAGGVVSQPDGLMLSPNFSGYRIRVAANSTGYLTVWNDSRDYETTRYNIFGRRASAAGIPTGSELILSHAPESQVGPAVAALGDEFFAVWLDNRPGQNPSAVYGTRIGAAGVLDPEGIRIGPAPSSSANNVPGVAGVNGQYLVVWVSRTEFGAADIVGARVNADGTVLDTDSFLISSLVRELHVVGVYAGRGPNGSPMPNHERGVGSVDVNRPGQSVTLVLGSYEPVAWRVSLGVGTIIERVFLLGYYANLVEGLPAGVPVITGQDFIGTDLESTYYLQALPRLCALTDQDLNSFHGASIAPATPIVIDAVQDDPRLRCNYPQPQTNNLPALSFRLAFFNSNRGLYFEDFTATGPVDGGSALPDVYAVPDAGGRYYYSADPFYVWKIDAQTSLVQDLFLPPSLPELSYPMGAAYDSQRNRVMLVSLGGEGFLYAYTPVNGAWSLVASMNNLDLDSLVYHAATDSVFGIGITYGDGATPLHELSADGVPRRAILLPVLPWRLGPGGLRSELVSVGNWLVWLIGPRSALDPNQESRMYLIDPRTGEVRLTYRRIGPPPNTLPTVAMTQPANNTTFATDQSVTLVASASDADGTIASVDFLLDGSFVGIGTGPNGASSGTWQLSLGGLAAGSHQLAARAIDNRGGTTVSYAILVTVVAAGDSDGDGVPDERDQCPGTPLGVVVNADGCSLARLCPCGGPRPEPVEGPWRDHAEYVRCAILNAWEFFRAGLVTADQRRAIVRDAARSNCGRHSVAAEPMQLHLLPLTLAESRAGGLQFVVSGDTAGECIVESSTDLVHWTPLQTVGADVMGNEITCRYAADESARFYRVRVAP